MFFVYRTSTSSFYGLVTVRKAVTRPFNCDHHWEHEFPFKFRDDDSRAMDMQLFSIRHGTRCILTCLPISWQVMSLCAHRTIIATVGVILIGV